MEVGESSTGGIPVAVSDAVSGLLEAFVVTVRVPAGAKPRAAGVTFSTMVQFDSAATVRLRHVDVPTIA